MAGSPASLTIEQRIGNCCPVFEFGGVVANRYHTSPSFMMEGSCVPTTSPSIYLESTRLIRRRKFEKAFCMGCVCLWRHRTTRPAGSLYDLPPHKNSRLYLLAHGFNGWYYRGLLVGRVPPTLNVRVFRHYMRRPSTWPTWRQLFGGFTQANRSCGFAIP